MFQVFHPAAWRDYSVLPPFPDIQCRNHDDGFFVMQASVLNLIKDGGVGESISDRSVKSRANVICRKNGGKFTQT